MLNHEVLILRNQMSQLQYEYEDAEEEINRLNKRIVDLEYRLAFTEKERDDLQDMVNQKWEPEHEHDDY